MADPNPTSPRSPLSAEQQARERHAKTLDMLPKILSLDRGEEDACRIGAAALRAPSARAELEQLKASDLEICGWPSAERLRALLREIDRRLAALAAGEPPS